MMTDSRSIFYSWQTAALLGIFFGARVLSYALTGHLYLQAVLVIVYLIIFAALYFKNHDYAWMILLCELLLGGSGNLFEFFGLSLRTLTLLTFITLWVFFSLLHRRHHHLRIPHYIFYLCLPLIAVIGFSATRGLMNGHGLSAVVGDTLPWLYLALAVPAAHLLQNSNSRDYLVRLIAVFLIGSAIFSVIVFFLYTSGALELHDSFYQWFRDIAMGKITRVTPYFYRIVVPEHLLVPPVLLVILSLLMRDGHQHKLWRVMFLLGAIILALDFSRSYFLGFAAGAIVLVYRHKFTEWIKENIWALAMFLIIFISLNGASSLGKSTGLEILGFRIASIAAPEIEESASTRLWLLEPIKEKIISRPFLGSGLGSTITYLNPVTLKNIKTSHFDWGYLELWAELGLVGVLWFITIIIVLIAETIKKIRSVYSFPDLYVGLLAATSCLIVATLTTPAMFHVFGLFSLGLSLALVTKPSEIVHEAELLIKRVFPA